MKDFGKAYKPNPSPNLNIKNKTTDKLPPIIIDFHKFGLI
jgi:hypothetical protein